MNSLGDILVANRHITQEELDIALSEQRRTGKLLGTILLQQGFVSESDLSAALASQGGGAFVDVASMQFDPEAIALIPEDFARGRFVVPILAGSETLMVAMRNSNDIDTIDELQHMTGRYLDVVQSTEKQILQALDRCYTKVRDEKEEKNLDELIASAESALGSQKDPSNAGGMAALVDYLLVYAVKKRATDIHIEPTETVLRSRYRIDGVLQAGPVLPKRLQSAVNTRLKIMANLDISVSRLPQDGQLSCQYASKTINLRFSSIPVVYGEKLVMRVLDESGLQVNMDKLGFLPNVLVSYQKILRKAYGVVLVTGPTGSGKTTTLYSSLMYLNSFEKNIVTLEDPIEYTLPLISQTQISDKSGLTFAMGLRAMLRQDPDILLVGEMRDSETASIAIQAALTGHLVLSTLHTNEASGAFARLNDMGVEAFLISSAISGVLAQRLMRQICSECAQPVETLNDIQQQILEELGMAPENAKFRQGLGCKACNGTGSKGRIAITEFLSVDDDIRRLITDGADSATIENTAIANGMITLRKDALVKCALGHISVTELERSGLWYR